MEAPTIHLHQELVSRCLAGERTAQYELYRKYSRAMYNVALRIVGDVDDAQDVLQEAFIRAFSKLDTFSGHSTFGAWLKRIVINQALTLIKQRRGELPLEEMGEEAYDEAPDFPEDMDAEVERVKWAVMQLPDGFRAVFSLYLLEGYDHREIAEILEISESTSKSQLNRAKKKVIEILQGDMRYEAQG